MPNEKAPWFVIDRSEALAGLLLTSRKDIRIVRETKRDDGVDFYLTIDEGEPLATRMFVVQVKGTTASDKSEWLKGNGEIFQPRSSTVFLPVCIVVVNVRDNRASYTWMAEPLVEEQSAKLRFPTQAEFHDLNPSAVNEIVARVKAWYEASLDH